MTQGTLHVVVGANALVRLRQTGCLKLRFPKPQDQGWLEAISLNNSGGVVGGDRLSTELHLAPDARFVLTTASAEKIYRAAARARAADIANRLCLERSAHAEWLPQGTILFDGCAMRRALQVEMVGSATLLGVEATVFGRIASGEALRSICVTDAIAIRRDGRLILHDAWRPPGDFGSIQRGSATLAGARAMATLFHVGSGAESCAAGVRDILAGHPRVEAGVSAWDGMLLVRLLAGEPPDLRAAVAALLHRLRDGRMLPRAWTC